MFLSPDKRRFYRDIKTSSDGDAFKRLKEPWKEYFDYSYQPGEEQLLYVDLGEFAVHLVNLYKGKSIVEFPNVFDIIEDFMLMGMILLKKPLLLDY